VLVSILILVNLLIGSSLAGRDGEHKNHGKKAGPQCQLLELTGFGPKSAINGKYSKLKQQLKGPGFKPRDPIHVYKKEGEEMYVFRYEVKEEKKEKGKKQKKDPKFFYGIGSKYEVDGKDESTILMKRQGHKTDKKLGKKGGVTCGPAEDEFECAFSSPSGDVMVTGNEEVSCVGPKQPGQEERGRNMNKFCLRRPHHRKCRQDELTGGANAHAMMEGDAVTEQSASGLSSGDFMLMAAGAAVGALLVAVAVAVVVAMRKRKSAKRTEMEMTEAVHVPDTSVMTPDATEKKAEGDEEAVTVHSSHAAEVTVSVSMDDEAVQVDA